MGNLGTADIRPIIVNQLTAAIADDPEFEPPRLHGEENILLVQDLRLRVTHSLDGCAQSMSVGDISLDLDISSRLCSPIQIDRRTIRCARGLTLGSLPGPIWCFSPGAPSRGQIGELEKTGIELDHLAQKDDRTVFLEDVLTIEKLPAAVLGVVSDQDERRIASKDSLQGHDHGVRRICKPPVGSHEPFSPFDP
jgi:hypothetical protein